MKRSTLSTLLLIIFLDSFIYFFVIPVFLHLFMHDPQSILSAQHTQKFRNQIYGLVVGMHGLVQMLAAPLLGQLSDRIGRKATMIGGLIAMVIAMLLGLFGVYFYSVSLVIISQVAAGVSAATQAVARAYVADNSQGKQRAFYFSLTTLAMVLAVMLAPLLGAICSAYSVHLAYAVMLAVAIVNVAFLWCYLPQDKVIQTVKKCSASLFTIWRLPIVRYLLLLFLLFEFAWSLYYQVIYLYWPQIYHKTIIDVSIYTTYLGLLMVLGTTVIYFQLLKRYRIQTIAIWGLAITGVGLLAIAIYSNFIAHWLMIGLPALAISVVYPSNLAWMSQRTPAEHQGRLMGFANAILALTWSTSSYMGAWLFNQHQQLPFQLAAAFMLLACLLMVLPYKKA